ncbi:peptide chain release factor N(5)-glutamine methyltransferase [cf. Phormidesmis sp. LEGE 11477]|uniref:peptide chain release factor N(5)-glutamine methyltransferase n=1 Tax=cf. Phormidesmis sp. LEGE 11477 TaxID=1828680 RepID=UPI0018804665|nr:peptide chain release factor N(5)-glutamine methyltransferase [cf. Phormidesmis sp. LEGE 11477]MBE9059399.1 peptide chain release factor N(5)-glutamine methyltransferase [cf. Phormidesmis sp. LEGE 11477]
MPVAISGQALYRWRQWAIQLAKENNADQSEVDWFLQGFSQLTPLSLRLNTYQDQPNILLTISLHELTEKWQQRIGQSVPVQYLTGEVPWRNFLLTVTPDVLIPRPETELIIDIATKLTADSPIARQEYTGEWADLGTGSGAIALGLAGAFPEATIHAVDISESALKIAQYNAQKHNLGDRITFCQGSWLSPLTHLKGQLTGIISNPPYIPSQTIATLQPEVANHEPHLALDGGPDGLDCIRHLIDSSAPYLQPGGLWLIELMKGQAKTVASLLSQQGNYNHINIHLDLSGVDRFVSAHKAL